VNNLIVKLGDLKVNDRKGCCKFRVILWSVGSGVPLVLRASAESWVQVRDSSGVSVLQRKLSAGETLSVGGSMPLAVVVGRADVIEVFVRGKPFDVLAVSRENVARFEVK
jgi:cytoskeleton protein RodZ